MMRTLLLLLVVGFVACAPKTDTSQLSPDGLRTLKLLQVVKAVNDATTVAITANASGRLSDDATAAVLTIHKQVLDVIEANPLTWPALAQAAIRNGREALPPDLNSIVSMYLSKVVMAIEGVQ